MNTKYKTAAVPQSLGKLVEVLPLAFRPVAPPGQRKVNSNERRPLKCTPSSGSLTSLSSAHSARSDVSSASGKRLTESKTLLHDENPLAHGAYQEDSIHFINSDAASTLSRELSATGISDSTQEKKTLTSTDILGLCQETELHKVYEIDLHGKGLAALPDLQKFQKLRTLDASGNHIKRIMGLQFNKELKELKLYDNSIKTIEGLENAKELCTLQLQHNQISSIGRGLGNLKKLQILRLDNNKISLLDTPELLSCSNITVLDLSWNQLETLAPLSYLPNLEELYAAGNRMKRTGDLSKCKKLQEVDLSRNGLTDISGLANLPNLQILDVSHNQLTTLKSVRKLISLEELNINANQVAVLSYFAHVFPKLQILFACDNMVTRWNEICSLSGLPALVELYITTNPFTLQDGEMPTYHHTVTQALPHLEVIDGALLKKPSGKQDSSAPVMRPMSPASIVSVHQVESQLKSCTEEQDTMLKNISEKFESLRSLVGMLPSEAPQLPMVKSDVTVSSNRCSGQSRIKDAQNFAAEHF